VAEKAFFVNKELAMRTVVFAATGMMLTTLCVGHVRADTIADRKAAGQGNAEAQTHLGVMYENGKGVPIDLAEAAHWYRLAAGQGNTLAQNNLGFMYQYGKGIPKDFAKTLRWYRPAAEK
jgi:hypothetical protein